MSVLEFVDTQPAARNGDGPTVYIETYGCQMNLADTELMFGHLLAAGYRRVAAPDEADVVLVNTCAVREKAETRVLGRLTQLGVHKQRRPEQVLGLCGCMAQHLREKILQESPVVDLVAGPDSYRRLPDLIEEARGHRLIDVRLDRDETYADMTPMRAEGVRAWVTIMRGCNRFCAFCIVPYTRGRERSLPPEIIVQQARRAVESGHPEVVLLGQTVNAYHHQGVDFASLLRRISGIEGLRRLRFTSPYPTDMTDDVIAVMADRENICPHVHLPLQSASDAVLSAMRREYTLADYHEVLEKLRAAIPGIAISTDIIVGFPGESENDFRATLDYMARVRFDSAFMFQYSPRQGARSFDWPETVPPEEKAWRLQAVIDQQEEISRQIHQRFIGREVEVLVEGPAKRGGNLFGKTPDFRTVVFPDQGASPGGMLQVQIESATGHSLRGAPARVRERTPAFHAV